MKPEPLPPITRTARGLAIYLRRHGGCPHDARDARQIREMDLADSNLNILLPKWRHQPTITQELADYAEEACQCHDHKNAAEIIRCIALMARDELHQYDAKVGHTHRPPTGLRQSPLEDFA